MKRKSSGIFCQHTAGRCGQSLWSRRLRHELSSLARTLESWVRIPLDAWMFVCVCFYSVCDRTRHCDGPINSPRSPTDWIISKFGCSHIHTGSVHQFPRCVVQLYSHYIVCGSTNRILPLPTTWTQVAPSVYYENTQCINKHIRYTRITLLIKWDSTISLT
jgi:hypothetical protein